VSPRSSLLALLLLLLGCGGTVDGGGKSSYQDAAPDERGESPTVPCAPGYVVVCVSPGHYQGCVDGVLGAVPCAPDIAICTFTGQCGALPDAGGDP